jgi:hypothetical protein
VAAVAEEGYQGSIIPYARGLSPVSSCQWPATDHRCSMHRPPVGANSFAIVFSYPVIAVSLKFSVSSASTGIQVELRKQMEPECENRQ